MSDSDQQPDTDQPANAVDSGALFAVCHARDWPWGEGENDNYGCVCVVCDQIYRGHKHSHICRRCHEKGEREWNAMTEEERDDRRRKVAREMREWYEANFTANR